MLNSITKEIKCFYGQGKKKDSKKVEDLRKAIIASFERQSTKEGTKI